MSHKKQGFLLPLAQFMEWIGLKDLPAQDPEWLEGEDHHPVGLDDDGDQTTLVVAIGQDATLFISQDDSLTPWFNARLLFKGYANGGANPPSILIERMTYPGFRGILDGSVENPSEKQVKALCQGFYLAVTNQTPIGTAANPLGPIESGVAADDLDARMAATGQSFGGHGKNVMSVTRRMFG